MTTADGLPQLTIDGGEVSSHKAAKRTQPLSSTQQAIIGRIRLDGSIRSVEAGVIVHASRTGPKGRRCGFGAKTTTAPPTKTRIGCCAYAAADGLSAMQRLQARGLVRKDSPGRWVAA